MEKSHKMLTPILRSAGALDKQHITLGYSPVLSHQKVTYNVKSRPTGFWGQWYIP